MSGKWQLPKKPGHCFICGRKTKLPIHKECIKKAAEMQKAKIGFASITVEQHNKSKSNTATKHYREGKVLPWFNA